MIGVYLRRRADFKLLGSTLDALTARDMAWGWILDPDGKDDPLESDFDRWIATGLDQRYAKVLLAVDADYVPRLARPTITIPYFWDNRLAPQPSGRIVCYTSERHLRTVQRLQSGTPDGPIVGWTEGDAWTLLSRHPQKEAILYTTKYRNSERHWSLADRWWYRQTCQRIASDYKSRRWAVTIKSREKHRDPSWLRRLGLYCLDTATYPSTSWQLLSRAQEITHFVSGVAWEAMVAGVPHRSIRVPIGTLVDYPGRREIEPALDGTVSREQFLGDWILPVDGKAGERVADILARYA